jgi:hypothetical protein
VPAPVFALDPGLLTAASCDARPSSGGVRKRAAVREEAGPPAEGGVARFAPGPAFRICTDRRRGRKSPQAAQCTAKATSHTRKDRNGRQTRT